MLVWKARKIAVLAVIEKKVDHGLASAHSEVAAEYGIAERDPQQTRIAVLLACGAEANLVVRIWYVGPRM